MRSIAGLSILLFMALLSIQVQAQRTRYGSIKGIVIDSVSRQPIESATVTAFLVADSSLINYAITNKKGEFVLQEIPQGKLCRLLVSYSGLGSHSQHLILDPDTQEHVLPTIRLRKSYTELEEVIVSARRPPILFKKDTIEFDAGSFKTAPNSVVEDLLKQLPGVEVDGQGNITVNGQRVSKITVNGRDFFGEDFKITSKNLPREIVDKIQVVDFQTRFGELSNSGTGNSDKVINLVLKKDVNKGVFGRGTVAYGTQQRYETGANLHYFDGPLQLSTIVYANNINFSSFSDGLSGVTGNGITESKGAGLNFNNEFGKKLSLNASYFINNSYQVNANATRRQNLLPDTSFFYDATFRNTLNRDEHRLNFKTDYQPDSATTVKVNLVYTNTPVTIGTANEAIFSSLQGQPVNAAVNLINNTLKDNNTGLELFFGRRLSKKGRSVSGSFNYSSNHRMARNLNQGNSVYYKTDGSRIYDTLDQQSTAVFNYSRFNLSASFTERISKRLSLVLRYTYSRSKGGEDKQTQRFNPLTEQYDQADTLFSNTVRTGHRTHFPFVSLSYGEAKFNMTLGAWGQWIRQENDVLQAKFHLVQNYHGVFPFSNIAYNYNHTGSIHLQYTGRSQQPTIDQLQTVPDNRNTLYIRLGNPHLRAAFYHNLQLSWRQSSKNNFWNARLELATIKNQIVYETWLDSVQFSKPLNTNGNYSLTGTLSFTRTFRKKGWTWRLISTSDGYYHRNVSFSNKIINITGTYGLSTTLGLSCAYQQVVTFQPSFSLRFNNIHFSFQRIQPDANISKTTGMNTLLNWPKRFIWENNIQYTHNSRTAPGFPKGITLWNMALNYQFLQQQKGTLRLSVFDLLQQSTSINRNITATYIEDIQIQVLRQYFLVSFIYNLKEFGR